ncbi:hypothetical protein [Mesorhizobium sp. M6A.T.Ce.TU.016.01.1.1]|uniref:hypothetical protein n=1 Tax=Mesorhizobium sp. M6A.T.Ce.TU.016.01.1.1 TaxID=2496783 RepID=UPI000FCC7714|nr:hypothetical protein [Mesorhizobium sp. M6A.T.Ce.TU.016.01.1.1]RUU29765.1 hypothetical protein EOC94_12930 [Mesorhizobium sp. M6A.T.Ce.TU.016.01.1.1]
MDPLEKSVRDAASALKKAITAAEAAGYRVIMPRLAADLDAIVVSSTAKNTKPADAKTAKEPAVKKS